MGKKKIGSKVGKKNQPFSLVPAISLSFLSFSLYHGLRPPPFLPTSFHHRLHYQWSLNSSLAAKQTPSVPLPLLQIFFSFFLPALPPETSSNYRPHHCARYSSPPPVCNFCNHLVCMQNVNSNCSRSAK